MRLALFDMDGTITRVDTTLDFVKRNAPRIKVIAGYIFVPFMVVLYWLGLLSDTRGKEKFYCFFFGGWDEARFREAARLYCSTRLPRVIKQSALERVQWHLERGDRVAVVSATVGLLVEGWCSARGIELVANSLEFRDGRQAGFCASCTGLARRLPGSRVSGRLATPNCFGPEKERRIRERFDPASFEYVYAYGDSRIGDREMLALADEPHFRTFR